MTGASDSSAGTYSPPLHLPGLTALLDRANQAIGRLDAINIILPNAGLFLDMYVRKEALGSAQIEGALCSFSDLLLHEELEAGSEDIRAVACSVLAAQYGIRRLRVDGSPVSLALIREIQERLPARGRGTLGQPGSFGPPPDWLMEALGAFERFLHAEEGLPLLIRAGLIHVQFESIHPFLDGNGRLGRLLIPLLLCHAGVLQEPLLYLSLYLKRHRDRYYELLQQVRQTGNWEEWLRFFLTGIQETADQAVESARRILALFDRDRQTVQSLGQGAASLLEIYTLFQKAPILTVRGAESRSSLSYPTVQRCFERLEQAGILRSAPGKKYGKRFQYGAYLDILAEGTEPIRRSA